MLCCPAWSPDQRRIAYPTDGYVYVMKIDGSGQRRLPRKAEFAEDPEWSPDGRRIAYSTHPLDPFTHIWVMNAYGSAQRRLTSSRMQDGEPAWSPEGRTIAFSRDPTQHGDPGGPAVYIYVMNADGSAIGGSHPPHASSLVKTAGRSPTSWASSSR